MNEDDKKEFWLKIIRDNDSQSDQKIFEYLSFLITYYVFQFDLDKEERMEFLDFMIERLKISVKLFREKSLEKDIFFPTYFSAYNFEECSRDEFLKSLFGREVKIDKKKPEVVWAKIFSQKESNNLEMFLSFEIDFFLYKNKIDPRKGFEDLGKTIRGVYLEWLDSKSQNKFNNYFYNYLEDNFLRKKD